MRPSANHTDNMGIWDDVRRGEEGCIGPKRADMWIETWELLIITRIKNWDLDVKPRQGAMTTEEKFVVEGNEKAGEWWRTEQWWIEEQWPWQRLSPSNSNRKCGAFSFPSGGTERQR